MKTNALLAQILELALDNGVEVTMRKFDSEVVYDMDTMAKSHLYVKPKGEGVVCYGRYDCEELVTDLEDFLYQVKGCLHGRDYMNSNWVQILVKAGILEVRTQTTTTFL